MNIRKKTQYHQKNRRGSIYLKISSLRLRSNLHLASIKHFVLVFSSCFLLVCLPMRCQRLKFKFLLHQLLNNDRCSQKPCISIFIVQPATEMGQCPSATTESTEHLCFKKVSWAITEFLFFPPILYGSNDHSQNRAALSCLPQQPQLGSNVSPLSLNYFKIK